MIQHRVTRFFFVIFALLTAFSTHSHANGYDEQEKIRRAAEQLQRIDEYERDEARKRYNKEHPENQDIRWYDGIDLSSNSDDDSLENCCCAVVIIILVSFIAVFFVDKKNGNLQKSSEKKCPFCAELIKSEAIVCRYCGKTIKNHEKSQS